MKQTLALLGLFFLGLALLASPSTGILSAGSTETTGAATTTTVITGEPPPAGDGDSTTTDPRTEPPTTDAGLSTTTTEPPTTSTNPPLTISVVGPVVESRFGPFQVEVLVEDGAIVDVDLVQEPGDRRSQRINDQAEPLYEAAVLTAQSADIDVISGATVTWRGYTGSLQAALDEAGLA